MRHFATMRAMLADTISKLQITRTTVLFSAMCWAVGLIVLAQQSSNVGVEPALLQVIFIGLAALTVPHMMLVDGYVEYQKISILNCQKTHCTVCHSPISKFFTVAVVRLTETQLNSTTGRIHYACPSWKPSILF